MKLVTAKSSFPLFRSPLSVKVSNGREKEKRVSGAEICIVYFANNFCVELGPSLKLFALLSF